MAELGYPEYRNPSYALIDEICNASDAEPDAPWHNYYKYAEKLQRKSGSVEGAPIERLGINTVLAILVFLWRRDHFDNGAIQEDIATGFAARVLKRLKKLDSGENRQLE